MKLVLARKDAATRSWLTAHPGWGIVHDRHPDWLLIKLENSVAETLLAEVPASRYILIPPLQASAKRLRQAVLDVIGAPASDAATVFDVLTDYLDREDFGIGVG